MKRMRLPAVLLLCLALCVTAGAEGVTLYTASCFAGSDPSGLAYAELLSAFEQDTGCEIRDDSMESSESWKKKIINDFAAGNEPDVLFFFAAGADSAPILRRVVPLDEINRDYPELRLYEEELFREADGHVYAVPVRPFWEGLFVNTELFERYQIDLPTDWTRFMNAIRRFREEGIVPLAASLTDSPHYVAEMAVLACADIEEQQARPKTAAEVPKSWTEAMGLIRELYLAGAFPDNVNATDAGATTALFREGKAAMQMDGSWFANGLSEEEMEHIAVLPVPRKDGKEQDAYIGGVSMGFYLTHRAYDHAQTRDPAVRLLGWLTNEENRKKLSGIELSGMTGETAEEMTGNGRRMVRPIQDDMNAAAREVWLLDCIAPLAEGDMTPDDCWARVMAQNPFE